MPNECEETFACGSAPEFDLAVVGTGDDKVILGKWGLSVGLSARLES